jgi:hypothetical protein
MMLMTRSGNRTHVIVLIFMVQAPLPPAPDMAVGAEPSFACLGWRVGPVARGPTCLPAFLGQVVLARKRRAKGPGPSL